MTRRVVQSDPSLVTAVVSQRSRDQERNAFEAHRNLFAAAATLLRNIGLVTSWLTS